jgi:hypothetical protein
MAAKPLPAPEAPISVQLFSGKKGILFNQNGNYAIGQGSSKTELKIKELPAPLALDSEWTIAFPLDHGAPEEIKVHRLRSLHKHPVAGVKYFSGTANYTKIFNVPSGWVKNDQRLFLDLGRVEVIAEVMINGKDKGIIWKAPYTVELTGDIVSGSNKLEIKVTNLWPNRLIGDEQQPAEYEFGAANKSTGGISKLPDWYTEDKPKPKSGRVAFTTWKHFTSESPLLESGLIGPVSLRSAFHLDI